MRPHNRIMTITGIVVGVFLLLMLLLSCGRSAPKTEAVSDTRQLTDKEILTYGGIDSVLDTFKTVTYEKLDTAYLKFSGYNKAIYRDGIKSKLFYSIAGEDLSRNLVGKFKINDFLPKDSTWSSNSISRGAKQSRYICIDREVLHRFLDLIVELGEKGYDKYALKIKDGFRYPNFNSRTGGARLSQHIFGRAIDLTVGDIDRDGKFTEGTDKKIVLAMLETDIIKDSGGVGHYPGTNAVHFDTRGYKARW